MSKFWNKVWLLSNAKNHKSFLANTSQLEAIQHRKCHHYIKTNISTKYGTKHDFDKIHNYKDFQSKVPIIDEYQSIRPYIDLIMQGHDKVLTHERPLFFETTSGSTSLPKYIPFTTTFKTELEVAVGIWMNELHISHPATLSGCAYWSLSPPLRPVNHPDSAIPIGTSTDTDYFNPLTKYILSKIMAIDSNLLDNTDAKSFYFSMATQLVAKQNLSFISVWSPTFLIQFTEFINTHWKSIVEASDIAIDRKFTLKNIPFKWANAFPNLTTVSCWTEAQAASWVPIMRYYLGDIIIQPKGLLSTEGVITIPTRWGNTLSYTSHFYEFKDMISGQVCTADRLQYGQQAEVIITTGSGLYRYNTHDVIEVLSMQPLPTMRFVGRGNQTSDLVGEKINALFLSQLSKKIIDKFPACHHMTVEPTTSNHQAQYRIWISANTPQDNDQIKQFAQQFLCQNEYYAQAIHLDQLQPAVINIISTDKWQKLINHYQTYKNIKDGDLKTPSILPVNFCVKSNFTL